MDPDKPLPAAPPTYLETFGNNVVHPTTQGEINDVIVVHPIEPSTTVIYIDEKIAASFEPYQDVCPHCQIPVLTRVEYKMGFCSWATVFLGIFLFWPLLCCFYCSCFKDAEHYCPNCNMLIATKKR